MTIAPKILVSLFILAVPSAPPCLSSDFQAYVYGSSPQRLTVQILGADFPHEIVFLRGTGAGTDVIETASCGSVATSLRRPQVIASVRPDTDGTKAFTVASDGSHALFQVLDTSTCQLSGLWHLTAGHPAPVQRTGQTESYVARGMGDDGDLQAGTPLLHETRFLVNGDGTVTDNQTGLVWLADGDCFGKLTWEDALERIQSLEPPDCGLAGMAPLRYPKWRLPNVREVLSLIDYGESLPALPRDHPFVNVRTDATYWTSTTLAGHSHTAFLANLGTGSLGVPYLAGKQIPAYVWPVKDVSDEPLR